MAETYFEKRMAELGWTSEQLLLNIKRADVKQIGEREPDYVFRAADDGGVMISYQRLDGFFEMFVPEGSRYEKPFWRKRNLPEDEGKVGKYGQPKGSGVHIFLTPRIVEKYNKGEKIDTLVATEGEFKAWSGYLAGLDIVGLPSINAYRQKDENVLHPTIMEILRVCKPDNFVLLFDGDCLRVNWDRWEQDVMYDLGKRLNLFYSAVKNVRDLAKGFVKDVYFAHLNDKDGPKGLDDLLLANKGNEKPVVDDLMKLSSARKFFQCDNVSVESASKLREYFLLSRSRDGLPTRFYNEHQGVLKDREFVFLKGKYQFNTLEGVLQMKEHEDSGRFIRVGCDYMKLILVPELINGIKVMRRKLNPWKVGEITRDYVNAGYKNFFNTIAKFDSFTNYPDHSDKFKQVIDSCYNLYYPLEHVASEGKWDVIDGYLRHVFGDKIDIGMDYMQMLYMNPTQKLPIIALVSEERGTGKTKFIELLREIFSENVTILGNDDITDNYNDDYASKLVICIDEGLIEKKVTVEKIKS